MGALNVDFINIHEAVDTIQDRQAYELHLGGWSYSNFFNETAWFHPIKSDGVLVSLSTAVGIERGGIKCVG